MWPFTCDTDWCGEFQYAANPVTSAIASGRAPTMDEVAETLAESDQTAAERD